MHDHSSDRVYFRLGAPYTTVSTTYWGQPNMNNASLLCRNICRVTLSGLFGLIASISFAQTPISAQKKDDAEAVACERQYREMEITAGASHQAGAMKEFCQNIAASCGAEGAEADCSRAKRDLPAALVQARKFREQRK